MKIGNRAFWFALMCGLTLLVGGAVANSLEVPAPLVKASEVNSQAANTAPTFVVGTGIVIDHLSESEVATGVVVQSDGRIYLGGTQYMHPDARFMLMRFLPDGTIDRDFGADGVVFTGFASQYGEARSIALQPDGNILLAGSTYLDKDNRYRNFAMARYRAGGGLDPAFGNSGRVVYSLSPFDDYAETIKLLSDGSILLAGTSSNMGYYSSAIAKFSEHGDLDLGFGNQGFSIGAYDSSISDMSILPDGRIITSQWANGPGSTRFSYARYLQTGSADTSLMSTGVVYTDLTPQSDTATSIVNQNDGKVLLAGRAYSGVGFIPYNFALVRYLQSGELDNSFGSSGVVTTSIASINSGPVVALQSDGKILLAGSSWAIGGHGFDFAVARFNEDGTLDYSFGENGWSLVDLGGGNEGAKSIALQSDGLILVAGDTDSLRSQDVGLIRLLPDGRLDKSFAPSNTLTTTGDLIANEQTALEFSRKAQVLDTELAALGTYDGATLTIARQGGANPEDVFTSSGNLTVLTPGSYFAVDGVTIGQVITNSSGILQLRFLGANATQAGVDKAMQQIAYTNTSDRPPAQVLIDWTFDDGNTGAQGTGGALSTTGTVTVNITPVNDPPRLDNPPPAQTAAVGTPFSYTLPANTFSDPDGDSLTYSAAMADNTGIPPWLSFNAATRTFTGTPSQGDVRSLTLKVTAKDPSNAEAVAYLALSVQNKPTLTASVTAANKPYDATPAATINACTLTGVIINPAIIYSTVRRHRRWISHENTIAPDGVASELT